MNAISKLERIRDLAKSKLLELQPFAGEEMNLPQTDAHRSGFVDGKKTLASQILALIDEEAQEAKPLEEEMVFGTLDSYGVGLGADDSGSSNVSTLMLSNQATPAG